VLDGEICALDERGRPSFSAMQRGEPGTPIVYYVFDVLEADGQPVVDEPLAARRRRLERLLDGRVRTVRVSEAFEDGRTLLEVAEQQGLEGVVAKRADSRYRSGRRGRDWLKVKTHGRQEFLVAGYTKGQGRRAQGFGALVLAVREGDELTYVGNVGTGFTDRDIRELLDRLRPLRRSTTPFARAPKMPKVRRGDVVWVEPKLVAEVEFAQWTHEGHLRAPAFVGLRDDKPPEDVHREEPFPRELRKGAGGSRSRTWTRSSSPGTASPRATCSPTTARSRPRSSRT
jgi:bifunctional non-homologous end joining protein LigD